MAKPVSSVPRVRYSTLNVWETHLRCQRLHSCYSRISFLFFYLFLSWELTGQRVFTTVTAEGFCGGPLRSSRWCCGLAGQLVHPPLTLDFQVLWRPPQLQEKCKSLIMRILAIPVTIQKRNLLSDLKFDPVLLQTLLPHPKSFQQHTYTWHVAWQYGQQTTCPTKCGRSKGRSNRISVDGA